MSQAKVDKYKKEKTNRQKIMKKQKWMHRFEMTGIALVAVLVVAARVRRRRLFLMPVQFRIICQI